MDRHNFYCRNKTSTGFNRQTGHKNGLGSLGFTKMAVSVSSVVHLHPVACASGCRGVKVSGLFPVRSLGSSSRDFVGGGRFSVVRERTVSTSSSNRSGEGALAVRAALFPFLQKEDKEKVKQELLDAIAPLERGAEATEEDIARVEKVHA